MQTPVASGWEEESDLDPKSSKAQSRQSEGREFLSLPCIPWSPRESAHASAVAPKEESFSPVSFSDPKETYESSTQAANFTEACLGLEQKDSSLTFFQRMGSFLSRCLKRR